MSDGSNFNDNSWINNPVTWGNATGGDVPLVGDINGDGRDDIIIFRTSGTYPNWFVNLAQANKSFDIYTDYSTTWGLPSDKPIIGQFNASGAEDIGLRRPSTAQWFLNYSTPGLNNTTDHSLVYGNTGNGDIPLIGNFNGDGASDLLIYRPATMNWFVDLYDASNGYYNGAPDIIYTWGNQVHDQPIVGDFSNDNKTDIAIFRADSQTQSDWPGDWFVSTSQGNGFVYNGWSTTWGDGDVHTEKPLVGDFNGDAAAGLEDFAIFRFWEN